MIAPAITPKTELLEYLARVYAPAKPSISACSLKSYRACINWLAAFKKRPAILADLSDSELAALAKFIVDSGRTRKYAVFIIERLLVLWRFAVWTRHLDNDGRPPRVKMLSLVPRGRQRWQSIDPSGKAPNPRIPTAEAKAAKVAPAAPPVPIEPATPDTLLDDLLRRYYGPARGLSESSAKSTYGSAVLKLSRYLQRPAKLSDLNTATLNAFITATLTTLRPHTVHGYRVTLLTLWRFAFDESYMQAPPRKVRKVKRPAIVIEAYDVSQLKRLLAFADAMSGVCRKTGIEKRVWFSTFILLCWTTGLKRGDVLALERPSIAVQPDGSGRLTVVMRKTGNSIARLLPADVMMMVERCMAQGEPRRIILAPWCHNRNLGAEFSELAERAGVGGCIKWLRRGSASEVERMYPGMGRYFLGHKTSSMFDLAYKCDRIVQRDIPLPPSADFTPTLRIEHKPDAGKDGAA